VALVVVDTSAAYYEGDDENANVQMGIHARRLRALVGLPGEPCVLVACHPVKNATPDNMVPPLPNKPRGCRGSMTGVF